MQNYEIVPESFVCTYCNISLSYAVNEQDALQAATAEIVKDSSKKKSRKRKTPSEKNSGSGPPKKRPSTANGANSGKVGGTSKTAPDKAISSKNKQKRNVALSSKKCRDRRIVTKKLQAS